MSRCLFLLLLAAGVLALGSQAQRPEQPKAAPPQQETSNKQEQAPPEEDESIVVKEYSFNPLQAEKELKVGNYYFKKGSYRAAAQRFREATKWNSGFAEAYLRLAEAEEKQKDAKAAREAYAKYLELEPEARNAPEIKRKLAKTNKRH